MNPKVDQIIQNAFRKPDFKSWHGDDPKLEFRSGLFTGDNWNDARVNLLRDLVDWIPIDTGREFDWDGNNARIFHNYCEDQHYVFIRVQDGPLYHIEWYKSRGRTEIVNMDGQPISLIEFQVLIRRLAEVFGERLLPSAD